MNKEKLVLIGNGMAGVRCIEEILKLAPDRFEITIFGKEPHPNYNRILLSKVLQGDTTVSDITINDWDWYTSHHITLYAGDPVVRVDTAKRKVISEQGRTIDYDHLIFATGSLPFMLPLPGSDKKGVTAFRDIHDCNFMVEASKSYKKAVVIGGGLLGLEAARGLLNLGMDVHVVHIYNHLMERQLDPTAALMLQKDLEKQGMRFLLQKQTEKIYGKKRVEGLLFKDGTKVSADLVVIAVGVRPNVKLAADSGLEINRAIVVNDYMETDIPNVYAVGECAEHRGMVYGLVAPLYEQGKVLAQRLCGMETESYEGSILYSQLKVSGIEVFSAGEIRDSEISTSLKIYDGIRHFYKKISVRDNKIVGALLYGNSSEGHKLLGYIKQQADVSVLEEAASNPSAPDAESLAMNATICSCNGVSKGAILAAVQENGCETVEEVRACTRASSTCGGCKPLVSAVLQLARKNKNAPLPPKETICSCTVYSHEELRDMVRGSDVRTVHEAMKAFHWKHEQGCAKCRPALQYYIGQSLTGGAAADIGPQGMPALSRLDNGTYAMGPRMHGGVTSAAQLRQLAELIDKYRIPSIKFDGAHIDLLGIQPQDVATISAELGLRMEPESLYGQPVQSVITCKGLEYARGALKDSVQMGTLLERRLESLQLPYEVSIGVSASPQHDAGTLTRDIGLVGAPGGWEIYVGGSSRTKVRHGELLCMEPSESKVLELVEAFLQWYREEARFGESIGSWVEREGLVQLREGLFNPPIRESLIDRMNQERYGAEHIPQPSAALTK
ncbi:nitrite reductase large subunit NirB [Paenibacillus rigui]|uniref:Nitrite reductase large subunit n=1 Tax=Paenibacillus rigui TaxID=554312 RepID=A0A229UKB3_9BACL|nr:nitrite reductase large subunit NirB [Paenibacillus rigui]OXM83811.1 nitrite reductase large subunit [Paenibacillus rigui]